MTEQEKLIQEIVLLTEQKLSQIGVKGIMITTIHQKEHTKDLCLSTHTNLTEEGIVETLNTLINMHDFMHTDSPGGTC